MIVDVHTHTPLHREEVPQGEAKIHGVWRPDKTVPLTHTWADYMCAMEAVDKAIVFNLAHDPRDLSRDPDGLQFQTFGMDAAQVNDDTTAFVRAHPEKLIGFMSVHPFDPEALDEIERAHGDLGLQGIKLGPNYQNFDPLGAEAMRVFKRAEELSLPVLFHQGTSPVRHADLDWAHPRHIDRLAIACPELKMILAHVAHPWQVDCLVVIRKHPNVYADISAQFYRPWSAYNAFVAATEWGVMPKLLFGSDYPVATPQETIDALYRVNDIVEGTKLPRVPLGPLEDLVQRDALTLLGLTA